MVSQLTTVGASPEKAWRAWELRGASTYLDKDGAAIDRLLAMTRIFADELDRLAVAMPILLEF
jgi:hypothetical protein